MIFVVSLTADRGRGRVTAGRVQLLVMVMVVGRSGRRGRGRRRRRVTVRGRRVERAERRRRHHGRRRFAVSGRGRVVEQVPRQVAVVRRERGRRGGRHRSRGAGGHASGRGRDGASGAAAGSVGADVLQEFVGRAEALAAQRRHGGRFGGGGRGWRRRLHVSAAGYHPAARVGAGDGGVERGHGSGGHQRGQVPLVVALHATGRTGAGRGHHRVILGGERQRGRGRGVVLLLLAATGSRAAAHRVFAVGRRRFSGRGGGQRHGGRHPRGAGQVRVPEGGQRVRFVRRVGRHRRRRAESLGRGAVHHFQSGPDDRVGGRVGRRRGGSGGRGRGGFRRGSGRRRPTAALVVRAVLVTRRRGLALLAVTASVVFGTAALGPALVVVVVVVAGMQVQTVGRRVMVLLHGVMRRRCQHGVLVRFKVQLCRFGRLFHVVVVVVPVVFGGRVAQVRRGGGGR